MKLADGYMVCEVAGGYCILPVGQNVVNYNHIFNLNINTSFVSNIKKVSIRKHMTIHYSAMLRFY